jgi:hypothetical protein
MASTVDSLWPTDIKATSKRLSPVAILKRQASLLGERTKNLVEAEVETKAADHQKKLQHWFYLVAPALDFYKYPLFRVEHSPTQFYPLSIRFNVRAETSTKGDRSSKFEGITSREQVMMLRVKSEGEFTAHLKTIFAADETKKVIQSLIDQSVG